MPSLPQPGTVPLCPSLLLQHPAELKRGGVGWGGLRTLGGPVS